MRETQKIRNQKVKVSFIQVTKQIISKEGVESVSVRKVADMAGYSYATIYNYFPDLNSLLEEVKMEMIRDVMVHMGDSFTVGGYAREDIKQLFREYAAYYLEHPHIFRFFYAYRPGLEENVPEYPFNFGSLWQKTFHSFVQSGTLKEAEVYVVSKTLIYTVHGLLALHFSGSGLTVDNMYDDINHIIDYLLRR